MTTGDPDEAAEVVRRIPALLEEHDEGARRDPMDDVVAALASRSADDAYRACISMGRPGGLSDVHFPDQPDATRELRELLDRLWSLAQGN